MATPEVSLTASVTPEAAVDQASRSFPPPAARRIVRGAILYTSAMSLVSLFFLITGRDGGALFGSMKVTWQHIVGGQR